MSAPRTSFVIGHRGAGHGRSGTGGGREVLRENTLEAFAEAGRRGAAGVELDARRTADGALVVHHDAVVPGLGVIADLSATVLPEWLPSLTDALDTCEAAGLSVIVELKDLPHEPGHDPSWPLAHEVAALVAERVATRDVDLLISSFAIDALRVVRSTEPEVRTAWLTLAGYDQHRALATAADLGCVALHANEADVTEALVEATHALGLRLDPWTVNDPQRLALLVAWGADGIMTDDVDAALAAIAAV